MSDPPLDIHQNPLYPRDANLTPDEFNAMLRASSYRRAISPGELICQIDNTSTDSTGTPTTPPVEFASAVQEHDATHVYQELMDFRHAKVIGDDKAWTYWQLYDVWAALQSPPAPVPPPVATIQGWYPRVIVNPQGIPGPSGQDPTWIGYTFATQILPQRIYPKSNGIHTRVTFMGYPMGLNFAYIGPISATDPWVASTMYQLTVNGIGSFSTNATSMSVTTDPLPFGLDGSRGWIISGAVATGGSLGFRNIEPGFACRELYGSDAANPDKRRYQPIYMFADAAILSVEAFYDVPTVI
jgi:hypothetical protein